MADGGKHDGASGKGHRNKGAGAFLAPNGKMVEIRDVWRDNLDEEMVLIRQVSSFVA